MGNRWVIPDIHGCFKTFKSLVEREIGLTKEDTLYLLGDYIDRGENSKEVIDYIIHITEESYNVNYLIGNHENIVLMHGKQTGTVCSGAAGLKETGENMVLQIH